MFLDLQGTFHIYPTLSVKQVACQDAVTSKGFGGLCYHLASEFTVAF